MLYRLARPLIFRLDAETAHTLALRAAAHLQNRADALRWVFEPWGDEALTQDTPFGRMWHPLGLAAGLDKDGVALRFWQAMGLSAVEVGTVTPGEQPGNARPRLARVPEHQALINRMGFPNQGVGPLLERITEHRRQGLEIPLGVSIGASKTSVELGPDQAIRDYEKCASIAAVADYLAINVSSPNTAGLRALQDSDFLREIVIATRQGMGDNARPLAIKVAPDLSADALRSIARLAAVMGVSAIIATNTTAVKKIGPFPGGVSGPPVCEKALQAVRILYDELHRIGAQNDILIIGVGGISTGRDALRFVRAGASLLQIYTALVYHGPGVVKKIVHELSQEIRRSGKHIKDLVGADPRLDRI